MNKKLSPSQKRRVRAVTNAITGELKVGDRVLFFKGGESLYALADKIGKKGHITTLPENHAFAMDAFVKLDGDPHEYVIAKKNLRVVI